MSKKALILTWERYQDHEVIYPYYRVQEEGFDVDIITPKEISNQRLMQFLVMGIQAQMIWFLYLRLIKPSIHLLKVQLIQSL